VDVTALQQQLTKQPADSVYLVLGEQAVLRQQALETFNQLIPDDQKVMNIGNYDMEVTPLATALDDATSAPFFGDQRLGYY
jgi:DNA polymerase-3 subunit delta